MNLSALREGIEETQNIENLAKDFYKNETRHEILHPSFSFLRFLITKFKINCYQFLKETDCNLGNYLPIENLIFLIRIPYKDKEEQNIEGLHIYPTLDQINKIKNVFREGSKNVYIDWLQLSYDGLGWNIIQSIGKDGRNSGFIFNVSDYWYLSPRYKAPSYKQKKIASESALDVELKIYGIKNGMPSTIIWMALENIEIALVGCGEIPPVTIKRAHDLFQIVKDGFLLVLNKLWYLMFYDKELWIENYLKNNIKIGIFRKTQDAVFDKINYCLRYPLRTKTENLDNKLIKEFCSLVDQMDTINKKLSKLKKDYIGFETEHGSRFDYNNSPCFPILKDAASRNNVIKLGQALIDSCGNIWGDLSNLPEMVKHDYIHSQNMEKIAIPWCVAVDKKGELSRTLLESIWLHDVGLNQYANSFTPNGLPDNIMESRLNQRKIHWYLGAERINDIIADCSLNIPPERISVLKKLIIYHSKKAPLTGNDTRIKPGNQRINMKSLSRITQSDFPYFIAVTMLRCIDAIDVQRNRCVWDKKGKEPFERWLELQTRANSFGRTYKEYKKLVEKQVLHFLKHGSFLSVVVYAEEGNSKIEYLPDLLSPAFLIFYAYAEAIMDLEKELTKINDSSVLRKIREEMGVRENDPISFGILMTDNSMLKVNYSLWGMRVDYTDKNQTKLLMNSFESLVNSYQFIDNR